MWKQESTLINDVGFDTDTLRPMGIALIIFFGRKRNTDVRFPFLGKFVGF